MATPLSVPEDNQISTGAYPYADNPSNFAKIPAGIYRHHILLGESGEIAISPKANEEDIVIFVLGCIMNHPGIYGGTKLHLSHFVDNMGTKTDRTHNYDKKREGDAPPSFIIHNDRSFRDMSASGYPYHDNPSNPSNFAKIPVGRYGDNIFLDVFGEITIKRNAYADDVIAFVLGCIMCRLDIELENKLHLAHFIDDMDARAVRLHGYSKSDIERDYKRVGAVERVTRSS